MSAASPMIESVLVAEFGRTMTRAFLIDRVDGAYRFLARGEAISTQEPPHDDLTIGLQAAVQQLEYIVGRRLLRQDRLMAPQVANGDGLDSFVAVANVGDPWRLAILDAGASSADVAAIADATRRMETLAYTIAPPGRGQRPGEWHAQHLAALATWRPDTILFITGPTPNPEHVARMIGLIKSVVSPPPGASRVEEAALPPVLVAAPEAIYTQVCDQAPPPSPVRHLAVAAPAALAERLAAELAKLADARALDRIQGYDSISDWSSVPVINRQKAAGLVTQYLARSGRRRVALLDVEEMIGLYVATPEWLTGAVVADVDLAMGVTNLLSQTSATALRRWLPFEMSEADLAHWAINRSLRPLTVSVDVHDQLIEQAFAREAAHLAAGRTATGVCAAAEVVIGSQWLGRWRSPAAAAAVLLDGVQPAPEAGVVSLTLDQAGLLPALGALAQAEPAAAAAVLESDALMSLGTALVVQGAADGQRAVSGVIQHATGETHAFEVKGGGLAVVPLGLNEVATVRLTLEGRASLGAARAGQTMQLDAPTHVRGGSVGLIVDARSRPLLLPDEPRRRQERLREWLAALSLLPTDD